MRYYVRRPAKMAGAVILTAVLAIGARGSPVWATESIDKVSIQVKSQLEAGSDRNEEISINDEGEVTVSAKSDDYEITAARWTTTRSGDLVIGEEPRIIVTLEPTDEGEAFFKSSYKEKDIKISGGEFVSARKNGADLIVTLKLKPVKGSFEPPEDAWWDEVVLGKAQWERDSKQGGAFEVWLYRGKKVVYKDELVRSANLNLYPYMTEEGVYTFKVRTVGNTENEKKYGKKSQWEESGELVIRAKDVSDGSREKGKKEPESSANDPGNLGLGWYQRDGGWYYRDNKGDDVRGEWLEIENSRYLLQADGKMLTGWHKVDDYWYYLDADGQLLTGWQRIDGRWYYLNPSWAEEPLGAAAYGWNIIDGYTYYFDADCAMYTGWLNDRGSWYYLNQLTEGGLEGVMMKGWIYRDGLYYYTDSNGVRLTGWQQIDGYWYYLYPEDGHKAVDTLINGFYVDGDGIWREGG